MQVRKKHLEQDMEQHTGSKEGNESVKVLYCHPPNLTYMQSISCEMAGLDEAQAGIKTTRRNVNNLRSNRCHPYGRKQRRTEEPLDESERRE